MVEAAFRHLRDAILNGQLEPGDKVPQEELSARLRISRMPLREALRKLEERHFVTIVPRRGAFVTPLSTENIREIYFIRTALEAASAGLAATKMDSARLARLREILDSAREAFAAEDHVILADLNREFHLVGHEATGSKMLMRLITDLTDHCQRYRLIHTTLSDRARTALDEHEEIYTAWQRRDPKAASRWVRVNLENSGAALITAIESAERDS
jgi:DNA-binding GntR family transcriptional regulator